MKIKYISLLFLIISCCSFANPLTGGHFVAQSGPKVWVVQAGQHSPSVVFLNGGGDALNVWSKVAPTIAKHTSVVLYDRPGLGKSPEQPPFVALTAKTVTIRLRALLKTIHAPKPYILVAHSIGGLYLNYYIRNYPSDVAGIVMVDGNTVSQVFWNKVKNLSPSNKKRAALFQIDNNKRIKLLQKQASLLIKLKRRTKKQQTALAHALEVLGKAPSVHQIQQSPKIPQNLPAIIITEGKGHSAEIWIASERQFANLFKNHRFIIKPNSGHYIQNDAPKTVINAILKLVNYTRSHH